MSDEFDELLGELTDDEYREWIFSWLDLDFIQDIYSNWDTDVKQESAIELKNIIARRNK